MVFTVPDDERYHDGYCLPQSITACLPVGGGPHFSYVPDSIHLSQ